MRHEAQERLAEVLADGIDVHRCAAARALAAVGGDAPEGLVRALLDPDPDVRVDAAAALAEIGDPATAPMLLENLIGDPEPDVKKAAIRALVGMRDEKVVPLLRKLVVERSDEIFWDEDEFYEEGWDSWVDIQLLAIEALGQLGDADAVPLILQALADSEGQDVEPVAIPALARLGAEGAAALADLLQGTRELTRLRIARAVAGIDSPDARALEDVLLADASADVRAVTLSGLAPRDARLEPLFDDASSDVRAAVVSHAGAHFPAATTTLFADPVARVRAAAFTLAARHPDLFRDDKALDAIRAGIAEDPQAASAAARAWVAIRGDKGARGFRHVMEKPDLPLDYRLGVVRALKAAGPRAARYLVPAIKDDARQLRLDAMTALAELATLDRVWPNPAGEALLAALRGELVPPPPEPEEVEAVLAEDAQDAPRQDISDDTPALRVEEGSTLDNILNPAPPPIARNMEVVASMPDADMEHLMEIAARTGFDRRKVPLDIEVAPHEDVRRFAATVLGNVPRAGVVEALTEALDDDDPEVVTAALTSLAEIGARAGLPEDLMGPLADFLATGPAPDRPLVARALSHIPDDEVDEWLRDLASEEEAQTRIEAIHGLERRGRAPDLLHEMLDDPNPGVACAAARTLARNKGAEAVPDLVRFACSNDGTWRRDVALWLAENAAEAAIQGFVALLRNEDEKRNWLVAIDALAVLLAHQPEAPARVAA